MTYGDAKKPARAGVIAKAEETFGNPGKTCRWLLRPTAALDGEAPMKLLDTEAGLRLVEDLLIRIDHGIAHAGTAAGTTTGIRQLTSPCHGESMAPWRSWKIS